MTTNSGNDAVSVAALILAGFAVLLGLLAVWLGRPRFGQPPTDAAPPGPDDSSRAGTVTIARPVVRAVVPARDRPAG